MVGGEESSRTTDIDGWVRRLLGLDFNTVSNPQNGTLAANVRQSLMLPQF